MNTSFICQCTKDTLKHHGHKILYNNKDQKQNPRFSSRHLHLQTTVAMNTSQNNKNALNILLCHRNKDTLRPQWPQISLEQQWSRIKLTPQWPWTLFTIINIKNVLNNLLCICPKSTFRPQWPQNLLNNKYHEWTRHSVLHLHQKHLPTQGSWK